MKLVLIGFIFSFTTGMIYLVGFNAGMNRGYQLGTQLEKPRSCR
jgi:hypothetical protein